MMKSLKSFAEFLLHSDTKKGSGCCCADGFLFITGVLCSYFAVISEFLFTTTEEEDCYR